MKTPAYHMTAYLFLALGILGILIPVLPGIPFLLIAGFMLTVNSPGLRRKILNHEHLNSVKSRLDRRGEDGLNVVDRVKLKSLMFLEAVIPKK